MWWLVGRLVIAARALAASRGVQLAAGGIVAADLINLDWLRQQSIRIAPGSDRAAIEQAARTAASLLGMAGDEVLWPTHRRGALQGEPITPMYLVVDLTRGRAWFSTRHISAKALFRAKRARRPYYRYGGGGYRSGGGQSVVKM